MNSDTPSLHGLRVRAGATQVTLDAFELENGCCPRDLRLIAEHNRLLRDNIESRDWLDLAEWKATGRCNFTPERFKKTK